MRLVAAAWVHAGVEYGCHHRKFCWTALTGSSVPAGPLVSWFDRRGEVEPGICGPWDTPGKGNLHWTLQSGGWWTFSIKAKWSVAMTQLAKHTRRQYVQNQVCLRSDRTWFTKTGSRPEFTSPWPTEPSSSVHGICTYIWKIQYGYILVSEFTLFFKL